MMKQLPWLMEIRDAVAEMEAEKGAMAREGQSDSLDNGRDEVLRRYKKLLAHTWELRDRLESVVATYGALARKNGLHGAFPDILQSAERLLDRAEPPETK